MTRINHTYFDIPCSAPVKINYQPLRLCMKCKRELEGGSNTPTGEPIPIGPNQSHGVCVECVREWGQELGLSEQNINNLETAARQAA